MPTHDPDFTNPGPSAVWRPGHGSGHGCGTVTGKPVLHPPTQRITETKQQVPGSRKRQQVVPHRIVGVMPLDAEPLLAARHMGVQRAIGKATAVNRSGVLPHIDNPAGVQKPHPGQPGDDGDHLPFSYRPLNRGKGGHLPARLAISARLGPQPDPAEPKHLPAVQRRTGGSKGRPSVSQQDPMMIDRTARRRAGARRAGLGIAVGAAGLDGQKGGRPRRIRLAKQHHGLTAQSNSL